MPPLHTHRLGEFLAEVSNWRYDDFSRAEKDEINYSTADSIVFALIRACVMENLASIKLAINRIDGKLVTPVQIVYPKVYFIYPQASSVDAAPIGYVPPVAISEPETITSTEVSVVVDSEEGNILPTLGLRQTLNRMIDYKRSIPKDIIAMALKVDLAVAGKAPMPPDEEIPLVKSVIAAHLISMAQNRNVDSLYEIFDNIDGKLVETIEIVGEDIYLTNYSLVAPYGSVKNSEGLYQIEATEARRLWEQKLGGTLDGD